MPWEPGKPITGVIQPLDGEMKQIQSHKPLIIALEAVMPWEGKEISYRGETHIPRLIVLDMLFQGPFIDCVIRGPAVQYLQPR